MTYEKFLPNAETLSMTMCSVENELMVGALQVVVVDSLVELMNSQNTMQYDARL